MDDLTLDMFFFFFLKSCNQCRMTGTVHLKLHRMPVCVLAGLRCESLKPRPPTWIATFGFSKHQEVAGTRSLALWILSTGSCNIYQRTWTPTTNNVVVVQDFSLTIYKKLYKLCFINLDIHEIIYTEIVSLDFCRRNHRESCNSLEINQFILA